ncbi:MAG: hypothetical protein O2890_11150, partial [Cyanobacteria bacterium]|nr:hypothetical protein [Cyanobacteriota bacterium]
MAESGNHSHNGNGNGPFRRYSPPSSSNGAGDMGPLGQGGSLPRPANPGGSNFDRPGLAQNLPPNPANRSARRRWRQGGQPQASAVPQG